MDRDEALARLTLRLLRMAEGVDADVDAVLGKIRGLVREGADGNQLGEASEELAHHVLSATGVGVDSNQAMPGALDVTGLSQLVKRMPVRSEDQQHLDGLVRRIAAGQSALERQAALSSLLKAAAEALVEVAARGRSESGAARGLFGRRRTDREEGQRDRSVMLFVELLTRLVDHIDVLNGSPSRGGELRQRLEGLQALEQAEALLKEVTREIDRIDDRIRQERAHASNFLGSLRERLESFEDAVTSVADEGRRSLERSEALEVDVGADVSGLSEAVTHGIDQEAVHGSLLRITERLARHVAEEREQYEAAQARVKELSEQVETLEQEADSLRNEIRDKADLALKDPLTGVYNRAGYEERSVELYARWKRAAAPLSIVFVDCNKFKEINDTYGHAAGDLVLMKVADILHERSRASDIVCRYGGDEFLLLLPDTPLSGAEIFARSVCQEVAHAGFNDNGRPLDVSISCGVTQLNDDDTMETALARADEAMYNAKKLEGTRVQAVA
ncbi:diguanylate cyclase [Pseudohaliea sp.]|uniref:diguanylate cyclase n=1 Tax=Pseudohaliea sp. TaxID=2740289 RepID=UPI0032EF3824